MSQKEARRTLEKSRRSEDFRRFFDNLGSNLLVEETAREDYADQKFENTNSPKGTFFQGLTRCWEVARTQSPCAPLTLASAMMFLATALTSWSRPSFRILRVLASGHELLIINVVCQIDDLEGLPTCLAPNDCRSGQIRLTSILN